MSDFDYRDFASNTLSDAVTGDEKDWDHPYSLTNLRDPDGILTGSALAAGGIGGALLAPKILGGVASTGSRVLGLAPTAAPVAAATEGAEAASPTVAGWLAKYLGKWGTRVMGGAGTLFAADYARNSGLFAPLVNRETHPDLALWLGDPVAKANEEANLAKRKQDIVDASEITKMGALRQGIKEDTDRQIKENRLNLLIQMEGQRRAQKMADMDSLMDRYLQAKQSSLMTIGQIMQGM